MKGKEFCASAWAASAFGGLLGAAIMTPSNWQLDTSRSRIIWAGTFFLVVFLCGDIGLQLALRFSRKYKVEMPRHWIIALLLAGVLLFGLGAGGQALFMYSREEITVPADVDMVLLLDASGSMAAANYSDSRTNAACQFVDSLSENNQLQAISFTGSVQDYSSMLVMDDGGKQTLKQLIRSIRSTGGTDFNEPLRKAMETLQNQGRADCNKAVLLLTDGMASISTEIRNAYLSSGIKVFSIRIDSSNRLSSNAKALVDFAVSTGGFDAQLVPQTGGGVDAANMLTAFQNAFQATSETRTNMSSDLIICSESATTWQFLVRAVTMMLCSVIFGLGYFGRIQMMPLLLHIGFGFVLCLLISFLGGGSYVVCVIMLCIMMAAAYVSLRPGMGEEMDV